MRPTSSQFQAAIGGPHKLAVQATVIDQAGNETQVPIVDGTVTLDQQAAVRGRCDVTVLVDPDNDTLGIVPDTAGSLLAPYGNEIRLARGVQFPDGTNELVNLGVFRIQETEVTDQAGGMQVRISGFDRAQRFIDARFEEPLQIPAGQNYATAIGDLLQAAWPDVPTLFTATTLTTPSIIAQEGDDRWSLAQSMATSIAMSLHFDGDGVCVLTPDVLSDPVFTLTEGDDGALLTAGRRWTRESTYNRVIATGENTGETTPVRGVATDDNPASPTYYFGPFGKVPRFYASPLLITDDQCAAAALTILNKELGTTQQVNFGAFVLPQLEPGDTVRITRERAGIDEDHVIDQLTLPLAAAGSMTGSTRARQVTA